MTGYILPGVLGLLLGLCLYWTRLHRPAGLRDALAFRRSDALRSALYALGFSMVLTALLCWLAVIDVDDIEVLPLTTAAIVGGVVFGAAAGICGFTPGTAFAGLGGGPPVTALCALAGCCAGTWLAPELSGAFAALREMGPYSATTVFRMTLDEPFLLDGGFLGQGCAGVLLMAIAVVIPSPRRRAAEVEAETATVEEAVEALPVEDEDREMPVEESLAEDEEDEIPMEELPVEDEAGEMPVEEPLAEDEEGETAEDALEDAATDESAPPDAPTDDPDTAPAFVALLPGEEPLVIDTEEDDRE